MNITTLNSQLDAYLSWLQKHVETLLDRLAEAGFEVAEAGFQSAVYDGSNDVSVSWESTGDRERAVIAMGSTAMFIEFGTGITYPDVHPQSGDLPAGRGQYGQGKGSWPSGWTYYGEQGSNATFVRHDEAKGDLWRTKGNPANMPMYRATQEIQERFEEIVRSVFNE